MNDGVRISSKKYIVYAHDDMYFCPNWDTEFYNEISKTSEKIFLSGTMIQPFKSFIHLDCGKTIGEFNEKNYSMNITLFFLRTFRVQHGHHH